MNEIMNVISSCVKYYLLTDTKMRDYLKKHGITA